MQRIGLLVVGLLGVAAGRDSEQSNNQQANALHAERLLRAVAPSTQVNYLQPVTALGHTPLRLSELLTPDRIRVPIRAQSKEGVLRELVDLLVGGNGAAPDVLQAVMERERQFPTGIGYGVAVPHGKTPALANLVAVAGTARTPVPYETVDGEPVRLFFLLAGPESQAGAHVKALSRISRLVRREPIRARLLTASVAQDPSLRRAAQGTRRSAGAIGGLGPPEPRPGRNRLHRPAGSGRHRPGLRWTGVGVGRAHRASAHAQERIRDHDRGGGRAAPAAGTERRAGDRRRGGPRDVAAPRRSRRD